MATLTTDRRCRRLRMASSSIGKKTGLSAWTSTRNFWMPVPIRNGGRLLRWLGLVVCDVHRNCNSCGGRMSTGGKIDFWYVPPKRSITQGIESGLFPCSRNCGQSYSGTFRWTNRRKTNLWSPNTKRHAGICTCRSRRLRVVRVWTRSFVHLTTCE